MKDLYLKIVSAEKVLFYGKVNVVQLPGIEGTFSVLSQHAPFISALKDGEVIFESENSEKKQFQINSGFAEINHNVVTVCVE